MPFFIFKCTACSAELKKLLRNAKAAEEFTGACHVCGMPIVQTLGTPDAQGYETLDEERGKRGFEGLSSMIEERSQKHFREVGVKKMIEQHGEEHARANGFIDEDGKAR